MEYRYRNKIPEPLWRVRRLGTSIDIAFMAYQAVYWRLTSTTAPLNFDRVIGGAYNRQEALHMSLAVKRERLERLKTQYDEANRIVDDVLAEIGDERLINILINRYVIGMRAEECAKKMHYGISWERELHKQALEEFRKIWKREP